MLVFVLIFAFAASGMAQEEQQSWVFNPKVELKNKNIFGDFWKTARERVAGSDKIDSVTYFAKADSV